MADERPPPTSVQEKHPSDTEFLSALGTTVIQATRPGRKGDPRMQRALEARLKNPSISLYDALREGGFVFYPYHDPNSGSETTMCDTDGILLRQRKNQLSRRLRTLKSRTGGGDFSGDLDDSDGGESNDEMNYSHSKPTNAFAGDDPSTKDPSTQSSMKDDLDRSNTNSVSSIRNMSVKRMHDAGDTSSNKFDKRRKSEMLNSSIHNMYESRDFHMNSDNMFRGEYDRTRFYNDSHRQTASEIASHLTMIDRNHPLSNDDVSTTRTTVAASDMNNPNNTLGTLVPMQNQFMVNMTNPSYSNGGLSSMYRADGIGDANRGWSHLPFPQLLPASCPPVHRATPVIDGHLLNLVNGIASSHTNTLLGSNNAPHPFPQTNLLSTLNNSWSLQVPGLNNSKGLMEALNNVERDRQVESMYSFDKDVLDHLSTNSLNQTIRSQSSGRDNNVPTRPNIDNVHVSDQRLYDSLVRRQKLQATTTQNELDTCMRTAMDLYRVESVSLMKKCMILAGFESNQTDECDSAYLTFLDHIIQYEKKRHKRFLVMLRGVRNDQESSTKSGSGTSSSITNSIGNSATAGEGKKVASDGNKPATNRNSTSKPACSIHDHFSFDPARAQVHCRSNCHDPDCFETSKAMNGGQEKCKLEGRHIHRLEGKCGHKAIIHKPKGGVAHVDFLVDNKIECYGHVKPAQSNDTAMWLSRFNCEEIMCGEKKGCEEHNFHVTTGKKQCDKDCLLGTEIEVPRVIDMTEIDMNSKEWLFDLLGQDDCSIDSTLVGLFKLGESAT